MSDDTDTPADVKIYRPARGKTIPMPGNQGHWPQEGRPINPLSGYENRLVLDGDLVPVTEKRAAASEPKPAAHRKAKPAAAKTVVAPPPAPAPADLVIPPASEPAGPDAETPDNGGNQ